MNLFKEHCGCDVEIKKIPIVIGDEEQGVSYILICNSCDEEIVSDEVFK